MHSKFLKVEIYKKSTSLFPILTGSNWKWMNVIPLLQTKTADTAHTRIFASVTTPFSHFWVGPGDKANLAALVISSRWRSAPVCGTTALLFCQILR